jgi:hypothetical protein
MQINIRMLLSVLYEFTSHKPEIEFAISVDNQLQMVQCADGQNHRFDYEFEDCESSNILKIELVMSGKNQTHTVVDDNNEIVSDSAVKIQQVILDDIDVTDYLCVGLPCYQHNNNGATDMLIDEFYGYVGQNGRITWNFGLPLYKWFLDKCQ